MSSWGFMDTNTCARLHVDWHEHRLSVRVHTHTHTHTPTSEFSVRPNLYIFLLSIQMSAAEQALLQVAEQIERAIDDEMSRVDNMDDDDLREIRRRRMMQLKEMERRRTEWLRKGHGEYTEVTDPKHFFDICKNSERVICHFMRRATSRCMILERHLKQLSKEHFETMFCYIDVERIPALAEKFNVVMLPTLMLVEKQNTFHSIIGFDEFGGNDEFTTDTVRTVLGTLGMVNDKGMFAADQSDD